MLGVTGWAQGLWSSASSFSLVSLSLRSKGHQEKFPISESGPNILVLFPSELSCVCESSPINTRAQLLTLWQWLGGGRGAPWQPSVRWRGVGEDQVEVGRRGWWKLLQFYSWTQSQREEACAAGLWEMTAAHISPCCGSSSSNPAFSIPELAPAETQEHKDGPGSSRPCGFAERLSQDSGVGIPSSAVDSLRASHKPPHTWQLQSSASIWIPK